jgi:hypothetical protein
MPPPHSPPGQPENPSPRPKYQYPGHIFGERMLTRPSSYRRPDVGAKAPVPRARRDVRFQRGRTLARRGPPPAIRDLSLSGLTTVLMCVRAD